VPDLWMQSVQDLRHGDQERGMRRLQQAIRKMHLQEEIGEFQAERDHKGTIKAPQGTLSFKERAGQMPAGNEGFEYHILALALAFAVMVRGAGPVSFDRVLSGKR